MINFRYHVVSLTAVFLALAIGLILGTAALNGPVANKISSQVSGLRNTNGQLRDQVDEMQARAASQNAFVREAAPALLAGRLAGRSVLVVSGPTAAKDDCDQTIAMLKTAGATVTGEVIMTKDYLDPTKDDTLQDLVARVTPAGVTTLPNDGVGVETASALLATVLLANTTPVTATNRAAITAANRATITAANRATVLSAYESLGVVHIQGQLATQPTAVVVVTGPPSTGDGASERNTAFLTVVKQFDALAAQMVLAAPTAGGSGNPVAAVRADGTLAKTISTVDGISLAEGQVATAMALTEQFNGHAGHYGTGKAATARIPALPA